MVHSPLLAGLFLGIVALAGGATVNNPQQLTIAPGACSGFEITGLNSKFTYAVQLDALSDQSCANSIRLSKLYLQGACVKDRNNQLGLDSAKDLTCTEAKDNSKETCTYIFSEGPSNALLNIGNLTNGQTFDSGNICANESTAFIYIQSNCTNSADVTITLQESSYDGPVCLDVAGHHLSGWAIAIVVVAIFIVLFVVFWMFWCCCCGSCCFCC